MSLELAPTTRMAIRAAAAAALGSAITHLVELQRAYWLVISAVALVNETWGDSVRKAIQRLAMTALGCVVGYLLYYLTPHERVVHLALILVFVFLAVYFRAGIPAPSYPAMIFFITVYVVFLFALSGNWGTGLIEARIIDTALGCGVALVVGWVVLPTPAAPQWQEELNALWALCRQRFEDAFACLLKPDNPSCTHPLQGRSDLLQKLDALRKKQEASAYEGLFGSPSTRRRAALVLHADILCRYILGLEEAAEASRGQAIVRALHDELVRLRDGVCAGFDALALPEAFPEKGPQGDEGEAAWEKSRQRAAELLSGNRIERTEFLAFGPVLHYTHKIVRALRDVRRDLV